MKKLLAILCAALILTACSGTTETPEVPDSTDNGGSGQNNTVIGDGQDTETSGPEGKMDAYLDSMDSYEDLEIAFLGLVDEYRTLDEVLERAEKEFGFSWIGEISEDNYVAGELGEYGNNVYLIIPARNVDLSIGKYSWYANEMVEIYYQSEDCEPFIYVETAEKTDRLAIIEYVRHHGEGANMGSMYTGFNLATSTLRTQYLMGIVDVTPYDKFAGGEVPFYLQSFMDSLSFVGEVQLAMQNNQQLSVMDEITYDGHSYALFVLLPPDGGGAGKETYYAVRYDSDNAKMEMMVASDAMNWSRIGYG